MEKMGFKHSNCQILIGIITIKNTMRKGKIYCLKTIKDKPHEITELFLNTAELHRMTKKGHHIM